MCGWNLVVSAKATAPVERLQVAAHIHAEGVSRVAAVEAKHGTRGGHGLYVG